MFGVTAVLLKGGFIAWRINVTVRFEVDSKVNSIFSSSEKPNRLSSLETATSILIFEPFVA